MLVCHCMAVYERHVREAIDDGAADVFDVADRCEAGTVCGGCVPTIVSLLDATDQTVIGARQPAAAFR